MLSCLFLKLISIFTPLKKLALISNKLSHLFPLKGNHKIKLFISSTFQRFYRFLELKSKDPDVAVPPIDDTLKKITEPDADLLLQNKSVIDSFCRSFELKGQPLVRMNPMVLFLNIECDIWNNHIN